MTRSTPSINEIGGRSGSSKSMPSLVVKGGVLGTAALSDQDVMALAYPRSTLLRCGVTVFTAVWDPGYSGRAEALLVVHNPVGFRLYENARVVQLVFTRLGSQVESAYQGRFNGENLRPGPHPYDARRRNA